MLGTIFLVTVPETIIRSAWRGRGAEDLHAEAGEVKAAGRVADHLDGAAGQAERQRPDRARPRPQL